MKQQENRAVIVWRGAASTGLVSSADRAYMKALVPRPTPNYGTKCPKLLNSLTKKQMDFPFFQFFVNIIYPMIFPFSSATKDSSGI